MASKSDSPNMVAHPESYVKFDVIFWEGAAWSSQASALFSRALWRVLLSLKRSLREEICSLPRLWVNLRTACGCPLQGAGKLSISRSFLMVIGHLKKHSFHHQFRYQSDLIPKLIPELIPKLTVVLSSYPSSMAIDDGYDDGIDDGYDDGIDDKTCGFKPSLSG